MAPSEFCSKYVVLRPDKATALGLIRFIFFSQLAKGDGSFIEFSNVDEEDLQREWLISLTLLGQMILLWISKPWRNFGLVVEGFLNLLSTDQNLVAIFLDLLQGKMPDRESPTFMTLLGHLDGRVELDRNFNPGDSNYNRALSAMAAKIAYENEEFIKATVTEHWELMELIDFQKYWNVYREKDTTEAFMVLDKSTDQEMIVVAFRGTEVFDANAWSTDIDISWYEFPPMGKVHGGFMKALGLQENGWLVQVKNSEHPSAYYSIRDKLRKLVNSNNQTKFIVTGHSLGGALAILFAAVLAFHEEKLLLKRLEGVYTFGQPRVGDDGFRRFMENKLERYDINYERIVYSNDVIPRVPFDNPTLMFKHFGKCLYCNSLYKIQILREEPNKNYFDPMAAIFKLLNAVWGLLRSFIIPDMEVPDYRESLLLKVFRVFGVIVPGIVAHNTHDYVNATRLGSIPLKDIELHIGHPVIPVEEK